MAEKVLWKTKKTWSGFSRSLGLLLFGALGYYFIANAINTLPVMENLMLFVYGAVLVAFVVIAYVSSSKKFLGTENVDVTIFEDGFGIDELFCKFDGKNAVLAHYPEIEGNGIWQLELTDPRGNVLKTEVTRHFETLRGVIRRSGLGGKIRIENVTYTLGKDRRKRFEK